MIEEQLFEVNKKIKQIQGILNRRQEKMAELAIDFRKIIAHKPNKSCYLKNHTTKIDFKSLDQSQYDSLKAELKKRATQSRAKVNNHYNELKDLDLLKKQKNKIRLLTLQHNLENKENSSNEPNNRTKQKQKNSAAENQNALMCRTLKERQNPFWNAKGEKFIELYQQAKSNEQNIGSKIMRHFGVGIETTPLASSLRKEDLKEEVTSKSDVKNREWSYLSKTTLVKKFSETFVKNEKTLGMTYQPRNIFEDRMRKIIKYHGQFWGKELSLE